MQNQEEPPATPSGQSREKSATNWPAKINHAARKKVTSESYRREVLCVKRPGRHTKTDKILRIPTNGEIATAAAETGDSQYDGRRQTFPHPRSGILRWLRLSSVDHPGRDMDCERCCWQCS